MKKIKLIWNILFGEIKTQGSPFVIKYENTSNKKESAILFGFNTYNNDPNYGNPTAVVITNLQGGTYGRLINQSGTKGMTIQKIKVFSKNHTNFEQSLIVNTVDENGHQFTSPISIIGHKNIYQEDFDYIDINREIKIDSRNFIGFEIEPLSYIIFSIFPEHIEINLWKIFKQKLKYFQACKN